MSKRVIVTMTITVDDVPDDVDPKDLDVSVDLAQCGAVKRGADGKSRGWREFGELVHDYEITSATVAT